MSTQRRKGFRAIAVFLAFAMAQVSMQMSFAEPTSSAPATALPQQFIARLATSGGSIIVNGLSASNGASLLTGANITTPAAVSATIDLGALGTVELPPGSSVQLDFADDGTVRVKLLSGCVKIKKKGPGEAEAYTGEGSSEKTRSGRKDMGFCYLNGALDPISEATAAGGGGTGTGIGGGATAVIVIAAIAVPVTLIAVFQGNDGENSSPMALPSN